MRVVSGIFPLIDLDVLDDRQLFEFALGLEQTVKNTFGRLHCAASPLFEDRFLRIAALEVEPDEHIASIERAVIQSIEASRNESASASRTEAGKSIDQAGGPFLIAILGQL